MQTPRAPSKRTRAGCSFTVELLGEPRTGGEHECAAMGIPVVGDIIDLLEFEGEDWG